MQSPCRAEILLHLERYTVLQYRTGMKHYNPPSETTAKGISRSIGRSEAWVTRWMKTLREDDLVDRVNAWAMPSSVSRSKKCSCYFLTEKGKALAKEMRVAMAAEAVIDRRVTA